MLVFSAARVAAPPPRRSRRAAPARRRSPLTCAGFQRRPPCPRRSRRRRRRRSPAHAPPAPPLPAHRGYERGLGLRDADGNYFNKQAGGRAAKARGVGAVGEGLGGLSKEEVALKRDLAARERQETAAALKKYMRATGRKWVPDEEYALPPKARGFKGNARARAAIKKLGADPKLAALVVGVMKELLLRNKKDLEGKCSVYDATARAGIRGDGKGKGIRGKGIRGRVIGKYTGFAKNKAHRLRGHDNDKKRLVRGDLPPRNVLCWESASALAVLEGGDAKFVELIGPEDGTGVSEHYGKTCELVLIHILGRMTVHGLGGCNMSAASAPTEYRKMVMNALAEEGSGVPDEFQPAVAFVRDCLRCDEEVTPAAVAAAAARRRRRAAP